MRLSRSENTEFTPRRRKRPSIAAQPLFVPLMTAWGAALAGLSIAVLPDQAISHMTSISALGVLGGFARLFFVALTAALGGATLYLIATQWRSSLPGNPSELLSKAAQHVQPIDPVADLGSESLDAPIEEEMVAANDAADIEPEVCDIAEERVETAEDDTLELSLDAICEAEPEPEAETPEDHEPHLKPAEPETAPAPPRAKGRKGTKRTELVHALTDHMARMAAEARSTGAEIPQTANALHGDDLDLGTFEQLPPERPMPRAVPATPHTRPVGSAADKLRSVPPHELSLVQMVERLAVALHEHREAARSKPQSNHEAKRDVALAEALKALSMFTQQGFNAETPVPASGVAEQAPVAEDTTQAELRDALGKLQTLRGAA
ncbi:MAG: hypothetical protein AAF250_13090 [Pseudomonadota bacterium]